MERDNFWVFPAHSKAQRVSAVVYVAQVIIQLSKTADYNAPVIGRSLITLSPVACVA